jgi:hypothetical protein
MNLPVFVEAESTNTTTISHNPVDQNPAPRYRLGPMPRKIWRTLPQFLEAIQRLFPVFPRNQPLLFRRPFTGLDFQQENFGDRLTELTNTARTIVAAPYYPDSQRYGNCRKKISADPA